MQLRKQIDINKLPSHVAIIMDGNGRWAKQRGLDRIFGHRSGVKAVREVIETATELEIGFLTLYAFSNENWGRPDEEVSALMGIMIQSLSNETETLLKNNIRLRTIGDTERLSVEVKERLFQTMSLTSLCTGLNLIIALSYSSRWEITMATKKISTDAKKGIVNPELISEHDFEKYLTTYGIPDPELMIRTGGELRISNFLLWQAAYAESFFTEKLWPDFGKNDFYIAI